MYAHMYITPFVTHTIMTVYNNYCIINANLYNLYYRIIANAIIVSCRVNVIIISLRTSFRPVWISIIITTLIFRTYCNNCIRNYV